MDAFIGEIRLIGANFAPANWAFCDGSSLSVTTYLELFALIGTTYGGDGSSSFNLPDLRSQVPVSMGLGLVLGQSGGAESVSLTASQTAAHNHGFVANGGTATSGTPAGNVLAASDTLQLYTQAAPNTAMGGSSIGPSSGSGAPHANIQPYLCINYIICCTNGVQPTPG